jgi:KipI family sensor histidine kinase inhibitor
VKLRAVGEDTLMLYLGEGASIETAAKVAAATTAIRNALGEDLVDLVPSYASVLVRFDLLGGDHRDMAGRIRASLGATTEHAQTAGKLVTLPVYYAPETGADLAALGARTGLHTDEVIALHSALEYRVYAIGFAPGFAYLGEVDERIATPRLATPRQCVPRGSVGIADRQTAVYPAESPGGWNLIGRCPTPMFEATRTPPMPVAVGDRVRFEPIDRERFLELGGELQ